MAKKRLQKAQSLTELLVLIVVLVVINVLGNVYYQRFDLTSEKRYTLTETSKKLASKLDEKLYFKLYLDGEMSSLFKQLRNEVRDMAYEFREVSGRKIEIEVTDPLKGKERSEVAKILEGFVQSGIEPVRDVENEDGDETRIKYLVPGAELIYRGKTVPVTFFEFDVSMDIETNIKRAIDNIEYEFANALRQCVVEKQKKIVVADGNGEMIDARVGSFAAELSKYYSLDAVNLNVADPESGRPFIQKIQANPDSADQILLNSLQRRLNSSDLLLVVKPEKDYTPAELYLIDQFMMNGGKVMWMIDPVHIEIDSFSKAMTNMAMVRGLENINASLFTYGVSINNDLLQDYTCNRIPMPVGGRMELTNFMYFPLFTNKDASHIITRNLGSVWAQFPATLKPKIRPDITTTPLLVSSNNTKIANAPATVEMITAFMQGRNPEYLKTMNAGPQISGVLMEGQFKSAFVNQKKLTGLPFKESGNTKMIVLADGDIMRNNVSSRGATFPTGYDKYSQITFANKKFLLNCIDYLIDDNGLIEIRSKEIGLRLLDQAKIKEEKTDWQIINVVFPVVIILIFGLVNYYIRRRKYAA